MILYELLTGHRPYRVAGRSPHEVLRVVCEEEPIKPSLAVTRVEPKNGGDDESAATPEAVSRARDEQPERLWRRLAGDLDNIVLTALRKEAARRYSSVEQFSEDIRRRLDGLPVTASRDTFGYRGAKFARRHRAALAVAASAALVLIFLTVFAFRKAAAASAQEREAKRQAEVAVQQRDNARAINDLFRNFLLKGHAKGPDARFMEVFDGLRKQIGEDTKSSREFRNDVNFTLGQILMQRGDYNAAEPHVRAVRELSLGLFGETHQRSINSIYHLGIIEGHKRNREAAVKMIRQAIEMTRLHHPESDALPFMLLDLGGRLGNQGEVEEAERLLLKARERFLKMEGTENRYAAANVLCNLGNLRLEYGQLDRAEKYYLEFLEQVRGMPAKYQVNEAPFRLGVIAYRRGDYRKA
ncbi:MAG: tetratricopeptide repeat protein, partial [Blastocatellia bacterium]